MVVVFIGLRITQSYNFKMVISLSCILLNLLTSDQKIFQPLNAGLYYVTDTSLALQLAQRITP